MGGGRPGTTSKSPVASFHGNDGMFKQLYDHVRSAAACREPVFLLQLTTDMRTHSGRQIDTTHHWGLAPCYILFTAMAVWPWRVYRSVPVFSYACNLLLSSRERPVSNFNSKSPPITKTGWISPRHTVWPNDYQSSSAPSVSRRSASRAQACLNLACGP